MGYTFLVDTLSAVGFNLCLSSRRRDLDDYMEVGKTELSFIGVRE
jgi:hypothetical protein